VVLITPATEVWYYRGRDLVVVFHGKHHLVQSLGTGNRRQRTANGLGVGSREQDVKRLASGVWMRCAFRICGFASGSHPPSMTWFEFFSNPFGSNPGRVTDVEIFTIP
jgi:hypothetical protein